MIFSRICKKITAVCCAALTFTASAALTGCDGQKDDKLRVVTTVYTSYDLTKQLLANYDKPYEVTYLLTPGGESHSYEPTPADAAAIQSCDLFVYIGGVSEQWAEEMIRTTKRTDKHNLRLFDCVTPLAEEHVEGMEEEHEEHDHDHADAEYDEHIWTSPENAYNMMQAIARELENTVPESAEQISESEMMLAVDMQNLVNEYDSAAQDAKGDTLIFADRFPFRYLTHAYGWKYYAAFAGCSSDTDASAATLSFLISKVKELDIKTVFYLENSSQKISDAVCKATGAKAVMLQSCNNVSKADFDAGKHYQDFMRENLTAIKEALG